ncbi:hypothetical protein ALC62_07618 [Cyphomyrmex costatus]|uniref:Uncharacterized protein n=1 Tax=Cyphomyrmex costatus TaxID=456900 RepID=A0A195CLP4_9HYME|nr:hypothetical protein ALC62_07618 [Cyphomyrmex costatus]
MMSMQSSDVMECETSASQASGNVSSADTSTWSTYLLGRVARFRRKSGDGGVGGPTGIYAEKGEEKEEVVNVEKPRRNPKRRCIDSNRQLSYILDCAADLRGMSRLIAGRDEKRETPVPRRRWCARATVEESRVRPKVLFVREKRSRRGRPRALPAHKTHACTRPFEVDDEGTTPRDTSWENSLIYLLIYLSESTSCTWYSVKCDGSEQESPDFADRTFESEEDAMGNPDKERFSSKNRVCGGLYIRENRNARGGADRDAPDRLMTGSRIIILGRYSTTMKYETWVAKIFHEVLFSIKQQGSSSRACSCALPKRDAPYAWLNRNAFSCTTDAIGFSRLSAGSTTSLMQPVLRRHWRAATVSPPIYEANTPARLY